MIGYVKRGNNDVERAGAHASRSDGAFPAGSFRDFDGNTLRVFNVARG